MDLASLKALLGHLNVDWATIESSLSQYGPVLLELVDELVKQGFTREFAVELLEKAGPVVMHVLLGWLQEQKALVGDLSVTAGVPAGVEQIILPFPGGTLVEMAILSYVLRHYGVEILDKLVPADLKPMVDQFGPKIIEILVGVLSRKFA